MRKVSIVLLVGLMLIGGLSVGVYAARGNGNSGNTDSAGSTVVDGVEVNPDVSIGVETIAVLYIPSSHTSVDLGDITSSLYNPSSDKWDNLTNSSTYTVKAFSNDTDGYTVTVSASKSGSSSSFGLEDLQMQGGALGTTNSDWKGLDSNQKVIDQSSAGAVSYSDIDYRYKPDNSDEPGSYTANLTYTLATK